MLPTLADLCGLKLPADSHLDGVSLAGLLRGTAGVAARADGGRRVQPDRRAESEKGDAAVLYGRWRLVSDRELYDIAADPGQTHDVAAEHPDVVQKMREHYGRWWAEIEPTVNQHSAITIGSDAENPTMLSPADWADVFLDQSAQVREGVHINGPWNVQVDRAGDYEFSLRRWPAESGLALDVADPTRVLREDVNPGLSHGPVSLVPSKALPIARARLKIGDMDQRSTSSRPTRRRSFACRCRPAAPSCKPGSTTLPATSCAERITSTCCENRGFAHLARRGSGG